jgi:sulfite reductase beta subunit-like hemoprotein
MESGDGLIVRVHPGLQEIAADKLSTLIALAESHGNGQIDVTRRANLQLRGISEAELPALQAALVASAWASADQAGERHFALLTSPLLGLDRKSAPLFALAQALERALISDAAPAWFHPKLCLVIDDAERALAELPFDLSLTPIADAPTRVRLSVSDEARRPCVLGSCALEDAVALVLCVISLLSEQPTRPLRMHEWAAAFGLEALRAALSPKLLREPDRKAQPNAHARAPSLLGFQQRTRSWFGVLFPFGSGSSAQWRDLLRLSTRFGSGSMCVTAQREVLLLDVPETAQGALAQAADAAGLVRSEQDPLRNVSACTGAPLCGSAHGETRLLARALAQTAGPFLMSGARLHVSGCSKSCAHGGTSDFTLVYSANGLHLAREKTAAEASQTAPLSRAKAEAALAAFAREYATCSRTTDGAARAPEDADSEKPE